MKGVAKGGGGQQGGAQDDISLFGFMFTTVIAWVD